MARGDHVKRQAHQFEAEIEGDKIGGRDQHQHAEGREEDEDRVFEPLLALAPIVVDRHHDGGGRTEDRQNFQKPGEAIDHETAAEGDEPPFRQHEDDNPRHHQKRDRGGVDRAHRALAAIGADHQERHGAEPEHDLRQ